MPCAAAKPSADCCTDGTGIEGSKPGSDLRRSATAACASALCAAPASMPTPHSSADFVKKATAREEVVYSRSGVVASNTLLGSLDSMFCQAKRAGAGAARVGATR